MRILFLFCDMLRGERLQLVNPDVPVPSPIDRWMKRLGGNCFTNAYTPAPDTARSIASFYTGLYPRRHGCRKVAQFAGFYLETRQHLLRDLLDRGYEVSCFLAPFMHKDGFLPRDVAPAMRIAYDFRGAIDSLRASRADRQAALFCFEDCHDAVLGPGTYSDGERHLSNALEILFDRIPPDTFDKIVLFSDHGCALQESESERINILDDSRTKIALFLHERGAVGVERRSELVSIMDIYPTIADWLQLPLANPIDGMSLLHPRADRFIVFEDDWHFKRTWWNHLDHVAHIWGLRERGYFFVETLEGEVRLREIVGGRRIDSQEVDPARLASFRERIAAHSCFYSQNRRDFEHSLVLRSYPTGAIASFSRADFDASGRRLRYTDGHAISKSVPRRRFGRVRRTLREVTRIRIPRLKKAIEALLSD